MWPCIIKATFDYIATIEEDKSTSCSTAVPTGGVLNARYWRDFGSAEALARCQTTCYHDPHRNTRNGTTTTGTTRSDSISYRISLKQQHQVASGISFHFLWAVLGMSLHHPHSLYLRRTGGTYDTHSSFDFGDISYLQLLNIFLIYLWTAHSLKATTLHHLPLLHFKNFQVTMCLLLFYHESKKPPKT